MVYAVTKTISRSSTIKLRCVVKRAGDALKQVETSGFDDNSTVKSNNRWNDWSENNPNWPASQLPSSSGDCGVRTAMMDSQPFLSYADNEHEHQWKQNRRAINLWPSLATPKQATALINPSYVLAAFTDIIFCKWHANIDKLDDEDMQKSLLLNILEEVKMSESVEVVHRSERRVFIAD
jgi:hypothetical protein